MKTTSRYKHYEDAPRGEWFLISEARGGLYGYRRPDVGDDDEIYITREVIDSQDDFALDGLPVYEPWLFSGMAKFMSGKYGVEGDPKWNNEDGHPCYQSYKDAGLRDWVVISETGAGVFCYRLPDGCVIAHRDSYSVGHCESEPDTPLFYYEEFDDLIRFFAGRDGVESFDVTEGGLAR